MIPLPDEMLPPMVGTGSFGSKVKSVDERLKLGVALESLLGASVPSFRGWQLRADSC